MRRLVYAFALLAAIGIFSAPSFADSFSIQAGGFTAVGPGTIFITPFDPSLGTLNSVDVTMQGTIDVTFLTIPEFDPRGNPLVVPYAFSVQQTTGAAPGVDPFVFPLANLVVSGQGLGGEVGNVDISFSDSFTFDSSTDLSGIAGVTSTAFATPGTGSGILGVDPLAGTFPSFAQGTVSGFESSFLPTLIEPLSVTTTPVAVQDVFPATETGTYTIQYNYTPTPVTPPANVPEPGTLSLLACGFVGLAGWGLLRSARAS